MHILCLIAFTYIPFLRSIWLSFFVTNPQGETVRFNDIRYYSRILNLDGSGRNEYLKSILTTVYFSLLVVPLGIVFALALALLATLKVKALVLPNDFHQQLIIGGASLWITDQGTPEQQAGAWDFVKWTSNPEVQAFWSSNTGYYPIRKAAYDVQEMKDTLAKYPQFGVAVEQLRATEPSFPTQGAVFGTFLQARLAIEASQVLPLGQRTWLPG